MRLPQIRISYGNPPCGRRPSSWSAWTKAKDGAKGAILLPEERTCRCGRGGGDSRRPSTSMGNGMSAQRADAVVVQQLGCNGNGCGTPSLDKQMVRAQRCPCQQHNARGAVCNPRGWRHCLLTRQEARGTPPVTCTPRCTHCHWHAGPSAARDTGLLSATLRRGHRAGKK